MSVEKTRPVGNSVAPTTRPDAELRKDSRPSLIERLADLQEASGALEDLRKGVHFTGVAVDRHTDHNDSHTDHNDSDGPKREPRDR